MDLHSLNMWADPGGRKEAVMMQCAHLGVGVGVRVGAGPVLGDLGLLSILSHCHAGMETQEQPTLQPSEAGKAHEGHWPLEMITKMIFKTKLSLFSQRQGTTPPDF